MTGKPYILAETTWQSVKDQQYDVAILPWGATEAHNYHLPFSTDNIQAASVAVESARNAWDQGANVIVLPTIPIGVNAQNRGLKLTLNLNPSTEAAILEDILDVLEDSGIYKLVILNGHGGNDFKPMIRELEPQTDIFICSVNWWTVVPPEDYFEIPGDHAGEMETSVLQFLTPDLVLPLSQAGPGTEKQVKIKALRERWVWSPREWINVSEDTGVGDPAASSAEKGEKFFKDACEKIAGFIVELARADLDDLYEK